FFFQAEDGIRDFHVTGVQTCALPICNVRARLRHHISTRVADQLGNLCPSGLTRDLEKYLGYRMSVLVEALSADLKRRYPDKKLQIGRASCRERVERAGKSGSVRSRTE